MAFHLNEGRIQVGLYIDNTCMGFYYFSFGWPLHSTQNRQMQLLMLHSPTICIKLFMENIVEHFDMAGGHPLQLPVLHKVPRPWLGTLEARL